MNGIATIRFGAARAAVTAGLLSLALNAPAEAELLELDQTIYGMDCAPCAIGVERRIAGLDGVSEVTLSLNKGNAVATFERDNRITLEQIREAIRRNAFNPREARITVGAEIALDDDGRRVLVTGAGERFVLKPDDAAPEAFKQLDAVGVGERAVVTGSVPAGKEGPWTLAVAELH